jgi:C-terminal processing protease CtpA/Prc
MKNNLKTILVLFLSSLLIQSCQDDNDISAPAIEVQNFIWKGLNQYYLWQADVPELADNKFANQNQLNNFLLGYPNPEDLFQNLLNKPVSKFSLPGEAIDRFSWIEPDYTLLEQELNGISKSNGIDFRLSRIVDGGQELVGTVRYILPNSDASTKNIKRGDFFTAVNGTPLTVDNYRILNTDSYTLNFADYKDATFVSNNKSVALTKTTLEENPIFINKVITSGTHKIGYLMYNGFYPTYDTQLNDAFGSLKSQGITELVLDLRYNGGGSVTSAVQLASMITGQFTGKLFAKEKWNNKLTSYFEKNSPQSLVNNFVDKIGGTPINSLNLTKIYILTSKGTASSSELIINGLKPYITVIQIGDVTYGKSVGSVTLYDSPTFGKENRNPNHKYAIQPIVLKIQNAAGVGDYINGLTPTVALIESSKNLGILGDTTEPLLATAIKVITTGTAKITQQKTSKDFDFFNDSKSLAGKNQMYIDEAPEGLLRALK